MKFKKVFAVLVLGIFLMSSLTSGAFAFKDMNTAKWAEKHVNKMIAQDVVKGYADGTFKPNKNVTQGEAVVMTMRMLGDITEATVDGSVYFKNTASIPDWVYKPAVMAASKGFIDVSKSDGFQYNKPATREWVAKLIVKAFSLEDKQVQLTFKDLNKISSTSLPFIRAAYSNGIIKGFPDNTVKPQKPVTRAEIVVMLQLADDLVVQDLPNPDVSVLANKFRGVITETYNNNVTGEVYLVLDIAKASQIKLPVNQSAKVYINGEAKTFNDIVVNSKAQVILDKNEKVVNFIEVVAKPATMPEAEKPQIQKPVNTDKTKGQQINKKK